jgi:carbonic anhydrase
MENWLRLIRDVYRLHMDELDAIKDDEARARRLVRRRRLRHLHMAIG